MLSVTYAQLLAAAPSGDPIVINAIASKSGVMFAKYGITSRNRALAFLSTALEESGFRTLTENLNYSAERAHEIFPSHFPTVESAQPYARNPEALANFVYAGRMGNTRPDSGWKYRGRNVIQITGYNNYVIVQKQTALPAVARPDIVNDPEHLLECALIIFCNFTGILAYADLENFPAVWALVGSGRANGRVNNLANHQNALDQLKRAIPALIDAPDPPPAPARPPAPIPVPAPAPAPPAPPLGLWARFLAWCASL